MHLPKQTTVIGVPAEMSPAMRSVLRRQPMGHTAYHHLGQDGDCVPSQRVRPGSHPYYLFGAQRRYPYDWKGGPGGVPWSRVAAESRGLGIFDLRESGLSPVRGAYLPYPAFKHTGLHDRGASPYVPTGDWPLVRPAGPEPDDPYGDGLGLSDNEKKLGLLLALGAIGYLAWKKLGRKNPVRKRFEVYATAKRRSRRLEYAGTFTGKRGAEDYAEYLRKGGHKARVRRKKR